MVSVQLNGKAMTASNHHGYAHPIHLLSKCNSPSLPHSLPPSLPSFLTWSLSGTSYTAKHHQGPARFSNPPSLPPSRPPSLPPSLTWSLSGTS